MKASLSIRAALAAVYASSALVIPTAATTCDDFEANPSTELTEEIRRIWVGLAGNCTGEGLFQMPRMTWTIEPNPDDSVNSTSVFLSPSNIGTVVVEDSNTEGSTILGIDVDPVAVANAIEIGVLVQTPKNSLREVEVENGAPFFVNIVKGFTNLRYLVLGRADTCYRVRDGYIELDCPTCDDLYTHAEVKGIGSSIVADLSEVNVEDDRGTNGPSLVVSSGGLASVNNFTLVLPDNGGNGVPVQLNFFGSASSKVEIIGDIDCSTDDVAFRDQHGVCVFLSNQAWGCKDCSNEMIIDGTINGYFNVSTEIPLDVKVPDGGCDHFALYSPFFLNRNMDQFKCTEGNATVNVEPLPCVSADIGTLECGTNPIRDHSNESACFCVAPLPDRECPPSSDGVSLGAAWIVSLLLPIAAALLG